MNRRYGIWSLSIWLLCGYACGRTTHGTERVLGGETHWLATCSERLPCEEGECLCGVCTTRCDEDASCDQGSSCFMAEDFERACGQGPAPNACLQVCEPGLICGRGQRCVDGVCMGGAPAETAALGCDLPASLPEACGACIQTACCDWASACGEGTRCGQDLRDAISPVAEFSSDFHALLGCMQDQCDEACSVTWGCVDDYEWPMPLQSDYRFTVEVIDFARSPEVPVSGVEVRACQSVDPSCAAGLVDRQTTDDDGLALLNVPARFDGYYKFGATDGYQPSIVHWTEPRHRINGFTHYDLTGVAVEAVTAVAGLDTQPGAGQVLFFAHSCVPSGVLEPDVEGGPATGAAGIRFEFEPNLGASSVVYVDEEGIALPAADRTGPLGYAIAFNVAAGSIQVRARRADTDELVAQGRIQVEADGVSVIHLLPMSRQDP